MTIEHTVAKRQSRAMHYYRAGLCTTIERGYVLLLKSVLSITTVDTVDTGDGKRRVAMKTD